MKMRKAIRVILLALFFLLTLSACDINFNINELYTVEINENGGSIESAMLLPKESYQEYVTEGGDLSELEEEGIELSFCTVDGVEYTKMSFTESFDSLEQLSSALNRMSIWIDPDDESATQKGYLQGVCVTADEKKHLLTVTGLVELTSPEYCQLCLLVIKFPGDITEHTIGTKIDDTTLEIDLKEISETGSAVEFTIRAKLPGGNGWLIAVLALCAVAAIGGLVYCKKRKSASPVAEADTPAEALESADAESQEDAAAASGAETE